MSPECRVCPDRDRSSPRCALQPCRTVALLIFEAAGQALDERDPMMLVGPTTHERRGASANEPARQLSEYFQAVSDCVEAHSQATTT